MSFVSSLATEGGLSVRERKTSAVIDAVNTDPSQPIKHVHDQGVILVRLKPESPGSEQYIDNGSTFSYKGYARIKLNLGGCTLWGREESRASGPFKVDAEIGATRGNDGTLALDAHADLTAQTASAGCGVPPGTGEAQRTLNFPDCKGVLALPRAVPPGVRTYRFDCTTRPSMGPGWAMTQFYAWGDRPGAVKSTGPARPLSGRVLTCA